MRSVCSSRRSWPSSHSHCRGRAGWGRVQCVSVLAARGHLDRSGMGRWAHATHHTLHYTPHTLHYTPHTLHYTPHTLHSTHHTLHSTHHTLHYIPIPYTILTIHYTISPYTTLYSPYTTLYSLYTTRQASSPCTGGTMLNVMGRRLAIIWTCQRPLTVTPSPTGIGQVSEAEAYIHTPYIHTLY
jgi:hypothetical protein